MTFSGFLCGGTLIDPSWVLTAAHCTFDGSNAPVAASAYAIRLGLTNRVTPEPTVEMRTVDQVVPNPAYVSGVSLEDDVALLHLTMPAVVGPAVATMDLVGPTDGVLWAAGATVQIAGWGTLSFGGTLPPGLRQASLPIVSDADCGAGNVYGSSFVATKMVCAGLLATGGIDTCQGDSGGPLAVNNPAGGRALVGATSWGVGCAAANAPGVYTRLDSYRDFVYGQVGVAAPGPPTGLHVRLAGGNAIVSWTPPTADGGRPVTGYRVTTILGGAVAPTVTGGSATSVTLTGGGVPACASVAVAVAAANARGFSADAVGVPPPCAVFLTAPTIAGSARAGHTLGGSAGTVTDPGAVLELHWQACGVTGEGCADIPGATAPTLVLSTALVGRRLQLRVTATNDGGTTAATSAQTAPVAAVFRAASIGGPSWSVVGGRRVITLRVHAEAGSVVTVRLLDKHGHVRAVVPTASRLGGKRARKIPGGLAATLGPGGRYVLRIATSSRNPSAGRLVVTFTDGEGHKVKLKVKVPAT